MRNRTEKIFIGIFTLLIFALIFVHFKFVTPLYKQVSAGTAKELTMEEKLEDFQYMYNVLKENHPYFEVKKRTLGYDWLSDKELFEGWIKQSKGDLDFYDTLDVILGSIQNGHTHLLYPSEWREYKVVFRDSQDEWSSTLNNKKVSERYKLWEEQEEAYEYDSGDGLFALPITFKYVEGYYAAEQEKSALPLKRFNIENGAILLEVDSITPDEYVLKQLDYEELSYDYKRKKYKLNSLSIWPDKNSKVLLKLKNPDGKIIECELEGVPDMEPQRDEPQVRVANRIIKIDKIAYLKVPTFDYLRIEKDGEEIYHFLSMVKDYPYLIIDIRGNSGGSDIYWEDNIVAPLIDKEINLDFNFVFRNGNLIKPFVKDITGNSDRLMEISSLSGDKNYPPELKRDFGYYTNLSMDVKPEKPVGFKGKIFLLTDDRVYSAAESFAAFAKESGWATLIGTPTGGDGICYDPVLFKLPNSGLLIRFPVGMGLNPDGTSNEEYHTQPDIYVEESYKDFLDNNNLKEEEKVDAILDTAIKLAK